MDEAIMHKAEVLVEALPYIQKFNRKIVVVKYGGSAMLDEKLKENVIKDVVLLKLVGFKPVIVHGGGKDISKWVERSGMEPRFVNGLRVTDAATMEIAEMVLNRVNKGLVQKVEALGVHAVGISGKDGGLLKVKKRYSGGEDIGFVGEITQVNPKIILDLLKVKKRYSGGEDIGFVGEITQVNPKIILDLLEKDFLPIVCPIGFDDNFDSYNINADDAACAVAEALHANKLAFLTDTEGVYRDFSDKSTFIHSMEVHEAEEFIASGGASGGMIPKLQNCIHALREGVARVHILDGRLPHSLLLEFFTNKGIGTVIINDKENK